MMPISLITYLWCNGCRLRVKCNQMCLNNLRRTRVLSYLIVHLSVLFNLCYWLYPLPVSIVHNVIKQKCTVGYLSRSNGGERMLSIVSWAFVLGVQKHALRLACANYNKFIIYSLPMHVRSYEWDSDVWYAVLSCIFIHTSLATY